MPPAVGLKVGTRVTVRRTPGGRSFSGAKTQALASVQRQVPCRRARGGSHREPGQAPGVATLSAAWANLAPVLAHPRHLACGLKLVI